MSDRDWTELDNLVKHRYETGAYGNAHLALSTSAWTAMRARDLPKPKPKLPWEPDLMQLLGIPMVVDDDLPDDEWRLVDNTTKQALRSGVLRGRT